MATQKPILISGAGLCSLLLAQSLLRSKIPFLVFERDKDVSFRAQGYRLRLSTEGLDAIESVLSPDDFKTFWDICGKTGGVGLAVVDPQTGETLPSPASQEQSNTEAERAKEQEDERDAKEAAARPVNSIDEKLGSRDGKIVGISRGDMRKNFMTGCEDYIKWSHNVTGYELTPTGVHAIFADGSRSVEGSMLIGGEGIYSKIAKQLSGGKLKVYDTGARGIHGQAPTTAFRALGEGVWRVTDDSHPKGTVFFITNVRAGDMNNPDVQFGWTMGAVPGVIKAPGDNYSTVGKPAADIAKALSKDWHPRLKPLFDEMIVEDAAFWKITCSTPTGVPEWKNEPRVTVIGDAVHSMTPAGGIGANTAVRDSALLGRLLGEAGGFAEGVTAAYEKEMRVYASEAVGISYGAAAKQFNILIDENSDTV